MVELDPLAQVVRVGQVGHRGSVWGSQVACLDPEQKLRGTRFEGRSGASGPREGSGASGCKWIKWGKWPRTLNPPHRQHSQHFLNMLDYTMFHFSRIVIFSCTTMYCKTLQDSVIFYFVL